MFDKDTFLTQEVDPDTCGDCKHAKVCHGRPFGANSNVRCMERGCKCLPRKEFLPLTLQTESCGPRTKKTAALERKVPNFKHDRHVRAIPYGRSA